MDHLLGVFGIDWRLLFIQIINFGVVLFALHLFLYKPVLKMISDRQEKVAKGVEEAKEAHLKLENARGEAKVLIEQAEKEAHDTELLSKKAAQEKAAAILAEAEAKKAAELQLAKQEAEEMKKKAVLESQNEVAKLAVLAAEKVLRAN